MINVVMSIDEEVIYESVKGRLMSFYNWTQEELGKISFTGYSIRLTGEAPTEFKFEDIQKSRGYVPTLSQMVDEMASNIDGYRRMFTQF